MRQFKLLEATTCLTNTVRYASEFFSLQFLTAETDDEARGFYEKCGFSCQSFKGVYGIRYKCNYQRG